MKKTKHKTDKKILDLISLKGKTAVVTGGGGHLGFQMSKALLELGAKVITIGQDEKKIKKLKDNFKTKVSFIKLDLNDEKEVLSLKKLLPNQVDILINNAYTWPTNPHFEKAKWSEVSKTLTTGITSPIFVSQVAWNKMKKGGSIINTASMYGMVSPNFKIYQNKGGGNAIEYGATKAALIQITKYLAIKGAPYNIRVNAISPGPFSPPGSLDGKEWFHQELKEMTPLGRIGENWELKGVVAFLASDLSTYMTGQNIPVEGGWTAW